MSNLPPEVEAALLCVPIESGSLTPFMTILTHIEEQAEEIKRLRADIIALRSCLETTEDVKNELRAERDRYKAMAEWLGSYTEWDAVYTWASDWGLDGSYHADNPLKAAEEAVRDD